jgi:hypothetical protein
MANWAAISTCVLSSPSDPSCHSQMMDATAVFAARLSFRIVGRP